MFAENPRRSSGASHLLLPLRTDLPELEPRESMYVEAERDEVPQNFQNDRPPRFYMESTKMKELQVKLACGIITLRNVGGKWKILCPYCEITTVRFYGTLHEGCAKSKKEFRCHILEDKCRGKRIDQDLRSTLLEAKKKLTGKTYTKLTKDMFNLKNDIPENLSGTLEELRATIASIEQHVDEAYSHCKSAGLIRTSVKSLQTSKPATSPTTPMDVHLDKHSEDKKIVSPGTFLKVKHAGRCVIVGKTSNFNTVSALRDKIAQIFELGDSEFDVLFKDSSDDDVQITTNESLSYAYQSSVANDQHSKTFHVVHRPPDSKSSKRNRPSPMLRPIPQPEKEVEDVAKVLEQMQISSKTFVKALKENNKFRLGAVTSLIGAHIPSKGLSSVFSKDDLPFYTFSAPDSRLRHPQRVRKHDVSMIIISATRQTTETLEKTFHLTGISQHYIIQRDGSVVQVVDEKHRAWHCGKGSWGRNEDLNSRSVGVIVQVVSLMFCLIVS
mmetsp:Transcript_11577/g.22777  ORF Transcript_11577/g.22777 Transcript_11577/m.22777 type:complete len:498 (-) Transcript_11577:624-2117(-)